VGEGDKKGTKKGEEVKGRSSPGPEDREKRKGQKEKRQKGKKGKGGKENDFRARKNCLTGD